MPWTKIKTYLVLIATLSALLWLFWKIDMNKILSGDQKANSLPLSPEFKGEWNAFYNEQNIPNQLTYEDWTHRISRSRPDLWSFWITNLLSLNPDKAYTLLQNPPVDSLIRDVRKYWNSNNPEVKKAKDEVFRVLSRYHSLTKVTHKHQSSIPSDPSGLSLNRTEPTFSKPLKIVAMVGLFQYQTALTDTTIWLGLDMFMTRNYRYYSSVEHLFQYQLNKTNPDYLPVAVARTLAADWVEHHATPTQNSQSTLLDLILNEGKIHACIRWMLPDAHDSLLLGYNSSQWEWIQQHENEVWKDLVSKDLLFSGDPAVIMRYLNDGPFSSGYPPQSPPAMGLFYGNAIVQQWIRNHPQSQKLKAWDLILKAPESDSYKFLRNSGYRGRN